MDSRAFPAPPASRLRAALYLRVSTSDRGQSVDNQMAPLAEAAARLGWEVVAVHRDEGVSGARGRDRRPGLEALLKGVVRGHYDVVAAWSVCRVGRSLPDLLAVMGELRARGVDLYLHRQAVDSGTPSGRMMFGLLGLFAEFEREMVRERVSAGLARARAQGKRLGRPPTTPARLARVRALLDEGRGVREAARLLRVSAATVSKVRREMLAEAEGDGPVVGTSAPRRAEGAAPQRGGEGRRATACRATRIGGVGPPPWPTTTSPHQRRRRHRCIVARRSDGGDHPGRPRRRREARDERDRLGRRVGDGARDGGRRPG